MDVELDLRLRTMRHHPFRAVLGPPCRGLLTALLVLAAVAVAVVAGAARLAATAARAARTARSSTGGGPGPRASSLP
ncbi:hypothetical protein ACFY00_20445 [Kitasatospora sp. NPDC001540]|uniref:hypothetical protein n=1 Tax=Kitasatospora sp. NPDC001540 TaxID=3364014 RepID=UPI0036C2C393